MQLTMPFSDTSNIPWFTEVVKSLSPRTVLDIGPGYGKYGRILKNQFSNLIVDAVEVWSPYIEKYGLPEFYRNIQIADVRSIAHHIEDLQRELGRICIMQTDPLQSFDVGQAIQ